MGGHSFHIKPYQADSQLHLWNQTFLTAEGITVKSEYMRSFEAFSQYSILKCRIRNFLFIRSESILKSEVVDNLIRTTYTTFFT